MNLSKAIKKAREKVGMQQKHLADKCGVSAAYLCKIEAGKKTPAIPLIKKIAQELKVSPYGLMLLAVESNDVKPEKRKLFNTLKPLLDKLTNILFLEEILNSKVAELSSEQLNMETILENLFSPLDRLDIEQLSDKKMLDTKGKGWSNKSMLSKMIIDFSKYKAVNSLRKEKKRKEKGVLEHAFN